MRRLSLKSTLFGVDPIDFGIKAKRYYFLKIRNSHFALIDFGIKAKQPRLHSILYRYFALIDFGIKAKLT